MILLAPDSDETFELSPEEKSLLLEAIVQADQGETIDGWQLLAELRASEYEHLISPRPEGA